MKLNYVDCIKPTNKQIAYAERIAKRLKIDLPEELTFDAYRKFISDNERAMILAEPCGFRYRGTVWELIRKYEKEKERMEFRREGGWCEYTDCRLCEHKYICDYRRK